MTSGNSVKRRRGGQPGNQNAKGNRGNPNPRRNYGNRGGRAPRGNNNARKARLAPHEILLRDYQDLPEARDWILDNAAALKDAVFQEDSRRDPGIYASHIGLTPDAISSRRQELRAGLFTEPEASYTYEEVEDEIAA